MAAAQISVAKTTSGLEILSSLPQANLIYKWKDFFLFLDASVHSLFQNRLRRKETKKMELRGLPATLISYSYTTGAQPRVTQFHLTYELRSFIV